MFFILEASYPKSPVLSIAKMKVFQIIFQGLFVLAMRPEKELDYSE